MSLCLYKQLHETESHTTTRHFDLCPTYTPTPQDIRLPRRRTGKHGHGSIFWLIAITCQRPIKIPKSSNPPYRMSLLTWCRYLQSCSCNAQRKDAGSGRDHRACRVSRDNRLVGPRPEVATRRCIEKEAVSRGHMVLFPCYIWRPFIGLAEEPQPFLLIEI